MIVDVILGNNIDTLSWISELLRNHSYEIVVVDYDFYGEPFLHDGILYLSHLEAKEYLKKYQNLNFYKSLCAYPGMNGKMSLGFK